MRIPSGDLSPARHRRYGGSYGRRRRRSVRGVLALVVLLVVGVGAYYALHRNDTTSAGRRDVRAAASPCPSASSRPVQPARQAPLPTPRAVTLRLLNGTPRNGLGKAVGDQLAVRGFRVTVAGNAPRPQVGRSAVRVGSAARPAGTLLARTVLGATLAVDPKAGKGSVTLVLGTTFVRLRTPAEVAALGRSEPDVRATASGSPFAPCR